MVIFMIAFRIGMSIYRKPEIPVFNWGLYFHLYILIITGVDIIKMVFKEGIFSSKFLRLRSLLADSRELEVDVAACNNTFRILSRS
jgi:hypothetical protein